MEQPRLKINGIEIGLRCIEDDLYEPKNNKILKDVVVNGHVNITSHSAYTLNPIGDAADFQKIESFCFVATKEVKEEAAVLLMSLRQFHDQPVYVTCDRETESFLRSENHSNIVFIQTCNSSELNKIKNSHFKKLFKGLNDFHRVDCIFKKMDCMRHALMYHENTFFLDSDIIVLDNLQERFTSDVVLSPHHYSSEGLHKGFEFGFYNAGYVFCSSKSFPNYWKHIYLTDSIFFEQEGMNRIPYDYEIQTFDETHNVGFWRESTDINKQYKSLHAHLFATKKIKASVLKSMNEEHRQFAMRYLEVHAPDIYEYVSNMLKRTRIQRKIAFIHYGKAAGVYIHQHLKKGLKNYTSYNSWRSDSNSYGVSNRDWLESELIDIAEHASRESYVHNHHVNWSRKSIDAFKRNGWFTFTFLRRPEELLCSLFNWANENNQQLWDKPTPKTLEDMFEAAMDPRYPYGIYRLWSLPEYIDDLDYVAEFNDDNFGNFLSDYCDMEYTPSKKTNTSSNKGFIHYRETGDISDRTAWKFLKHPEYERFLTYL